MTNWRDLSVPHHSPPNLKQLLMDPSLTWEILSRIVTCDTEDGDGLPFYAQRQEEGWETTSSSSASFVMACPIIIHDDDNDSYSLGCPALYSQKAITDEYNRVMRLNHAGASHTISVAEVSTWLGVNENVAEALIQKEGGLTVLESEDIDESANNLLKNRQVDDNRVEYLQRRVHGSLLGMTVPTSVSHSPEIILSRILYCYLTLVSFIYC